MSALRLALLLALLAFTGADPVRHGPGHDYPQTPRLPGDPDYCGCILDEDW